MEKITKKELAAAVAESLATTSAEGKNAVEVILNEISTALSEGKTVDLAGFGKFELVEKAERNGINPFTKEPIVIAAKNVVKFKPSKTLRDKVN